MIKVVVMKTLCCLLIAAFYCFLLLKSSTTKGQAKLVLNGAKINLTNNSYLVLDNPASDALIRHNGHVISEGEKNFVKWHLAGFTGAYVVPWGFGPSEYLPLSFTKSAGSGNGYYLFSTYQTGWQNSLRLPEGVTNLSGSLADNSSFVLDRFWKIDARDYTLLPNLTNVKLNYLQSEVDAGENMITENSLGIQAWNKRTQTWGDFQPAGAVNMEVNAFSISSLPVSEDYNWYTLVDRAYPLPLDFVSFEARIVAKAVKLNWVTANEINCRDFEIQRSADALNFKTLATRPAANKQLNSYQFMDNTPFTGISYYRLKQNDLDGKVKYSPVRSVSIGALPEFRIYPNPTEDRNLVVYLGEAPLNTYTIYLFDQQGKVVHWVEKNMDQNAFLLKFPVSIKPGIYLLRISSAAISRQVKIVFK
ncbi:MAG: T9SS type A sorting domain-containing protein [Adhaeribacter sp.]